MANPKPSRGWTLQPSPPEGREGVWGVCRAPTRPAPPDSCHMTWVPPSIFLGARMLGGLRTRVRLRSCGLGHSSATLCARPPAHPRVPHDATGGMISKPGGRAGQVVRGRRISGRDRLKRAGWLRKGQPSSRHPLHRCALKLTLSRGTSGSKWTEMGGKPPSVLCLFFPLRIIPRGPIANPKPLADLMNRYPLLIERSDTRLDLLSNWRA
jgi:hypothetical protein